MKNQQDVVVGCGNKEEGNIWSLGSVRHGSRGITMVKKQKGRVVIDSDTEDSGSDDNLDQGTQVQSLVWEDPTCRGATKPVCHNC